MPKLLSKDAPSHTLTRLLDPAAAEGAMRPAAPPSIPGGPSQPTARPFAVAAPPEWTTPGLVKRECVLTRQTDEALSRLTETVRRTTGARINASQSIRALLNALAPVWPRLEDELRALGPLRLPSNARGREHEREALERSLTSAMLRAMRSSTGGG